MIRTFLVSILFTVSASAANNVSAASFVPDNCSVESWCLVKATKCFVGLVEVSGGAYYAHSRYSVVRRAVALCPMYPNGDLQRITITGPVEPVEFRSGAGISPEEAKSEAWSICDAYRNDWVDAAPACEN